MGTQFGPYRIDELLGRGGMGVVYRAYDTEKQRVVALKLLGAGPADDPIYQERFRRESQAAARLAEPHVIPIHDWGEIDGVLYLDMRYVDGEDLRALLRREGAIAPARAVAIIDQVASALDAAHRDGLVHRDIKPENILLAANDFAYLVDFGIAHGDADTHLTQVGTAIGSVAYMAPELFDSAAVSPATDIYALTCVLFECLTGRVPHPATTISAAIKAAVFDDVPDPSSINAGVPHAFDTVIARGLASDPASRYRSTAELAEAARLALRDDVGADDATTVIVPPVVVGDPADPRYRETQVSSTSGPVSRAYSETPPTLNYSGPQYAGAQGVSSGEHAAPQYFAAPYPTIPPPGPPRGDRGTLPWILGALIAILVLALVGLGAYWLLSQRSGGAGTSAGRSTPTVTQTVTPTNPATAPASTVQSGPPAGATPCGAGVAVGTSITSCPFALAVRDEYLRTGPAGRSTTIVAYSPITEQSYRMACAPLAGSAVVACRGGNDALVYIY